MEIESKLVSNKDFEALFPCPFPTRFTMRRANGESDFGPSLTQPDQDMSVLEILQRFAQGIDPGISKVPIYDDDADNDNYDDETFYSPDDLADIHPDEIRELREKSTTKLNAFVAESNKNDDDE